MPDNDRLIRQYQKKSRKAFDELYRNYSGLVFGICLRYTRNRAEAEDLLQDCFIKVIQKIDDFGFKGSFEGWIRRIAVTTALNKLRADKQMMVSEIDENLVLVDDSESASVASKLNADQLVEIINSLPVGYKTVFNLYVVEGYRHKEIADMLGCSENTSKSQLLKAKKAIIERLNLLKENDEREF